MLVVSGDKPPEKSIRSNKFSFSKTSKYPFNIVAPLIKTLSFTGGT